MDQSTMRHPNSAVLGSVKIEIAETVRFIEENGKQTFVLEDFTDLGLGRGFSATPNSTNIEIQADNGTVPLSGKTNVSYSIAGNLLERHLPTLSKMLKGQVYVFPITQEPKNYTETLAAGEYNDYWVFGAWNADGTAPTNVTVSQDDTPLNLDTDYRIEKINDLWTIIFLNSPDAEKEITITYTVKSAKSWRLTRGSGGVGSHYALRLTNKREADDGSIITRVWEFPYVVFDGEQNLSFKASGESDTVMEVPISFKATAHPDMVDDEDLAKESLMRETVSGNAIDG